MVIQSSTISMASERSYRENYSGLAAMTSFGQIMSATLPEARDGGFDSLSDQEKSHLLASYDANGRYTFDDKVSTKDVTDIELKDSFSYEECEVETYVKSETTKAVMKNVLNAKSVYVMSIRELLSQMIARRREFLNYLLNLNHSGSTSGSFYVVKSEAFTYNYSEEESTSFKADGKVTTADGRSIDFNIDMLMSRSFSEQYTYEHESISEVFKDPLVINLKGGPVSLKDQTFTFDIDSDGELDNLAVLGEFCGYLALDKNGDGVINDGSELFGAKTGHGFDELAVFDMDGNGWIDENDEIFDKLRIWSKDADGNDRLVGIGVAGVGAICLTNVSTNFSIKNEVNETLGKVRNSGVALMEDGNVASVQQVDMAVQAG